MGKKRWIGNILFRDLARKQGILATGRNGEEKEGLERGNGSRANEFSNFVSSRLSSITTRPGIFGAIFPPLSLQGHRKGWKRKQSRARSSLNGTPSVVASHRYQTSRASCSRKSDASKSILALLVSREIDQIKKKKIGILASIWFEEHTLASRKKKGRRVIIFIAVLERQRCKRASFKSNLARLPFKLPFV